MAEWATTFGSWTGGAITISNGNLTFAGGNTALGDDISVDGGKGTVFNDDPLRISAPQKITGKFNQSAMGSLIFGLAGDMAGQYGALDISGSASLAGGLGFDLTNDFTLAAGDTFDDLLMSGGALSGDFGACRSTSALSATSPTSGAAAMSGSISISTS